MTIYEFKQLSKEKRYILWLAKATEISFYDKGMYYYVLYQLETFYVEMRMLKLFPGTTRMIAFCDGERLEPYLDKIDISQVTV